jgi:acyl-CoA reductase-like NAD-dependent aldehyde dehydrogenase
MACKFRCSGQTCICANRILVQEGIHDKFVEALAEAMKEQLKVGSGFEKDTNQGPLINKTAISKMEHLVQDANVKGARIVTGGKKLDILSGNFFEPTLVTNINFDMDISREEIFGPIASIIKFNKFFLFYYL